LKIHIIGVARVKLKYVIYSFFDTLKSVYCLLFIFYLCRKNKSFYDFDNIYGKRINTFFIQVFYNKMIAISRADVFMKKLITLANSDLKTVKDDVVLLLGETGSGKSTIMNMIAGSKIFVV
jgi:ABC-type multidrug transport system fused ATPase/permease subunit